jgi:hypothetical protein
LEDDEKLMKSFLDYRVGQTYRVLGSKKHRPSSLETYIEKMPGRGHPGREEAGQEGKNFRLADERLGPGQGGFVSSKATMVRSMPPVPKMGI